jgi:hypothetical protein
MSRQNVVNGQHAFERNDVREPDTALAPVPNLRVSNSITSAQAAKRWCPFVRIREYQEGQMDGTAVNRSFDSADSAASGSLCLASNCMAWRWDISHTWLEDEEERRHEPRGYCGLAGQPH